MIAGGPGELGGGCQYFGREVTTKPSLSRVTVDRVCAGRVVVVAEVVVEVDERVDE